MLFVFLRYSLLTLFLASILYHWIWTRYCDIPGSLIKVLKSWSCHCWTMGYKKESIHIPSKMMWKAKDWNIDSCNYTSTSYTPILNISKFLNQFKEFSWTFSYNPILPILKSILRIFQHLHIYASTVHFSILSSILRDFHLHMLIMHISLFLNLFYGLFSTSTCQPIRHISPCWNLFWDIFSTSPKYANTA